MPLTELDHPVWHALSGAHRPLSIRRGEAARYRPTVASFAAIPPGDDARDWDDLAAIAGGDEVVLFGLPREVPSGWEETAHFEVVQMTVPESFGRRHEGVVRLTADDAPAMLALIAEAQPGPFFAETHLMGAYYGIKEDGRLVAMAGERLTTGSWTEVSAVCTRDTHRGRGLATVLMEVVAHGIREAGRRPFLHTGASNATALRLYDHLGFEARDTGNAVQIVRVAGSTGAAATLHH
ncbi:GNAT family N-acetyltransferase [Demequina sp. SYSU T00192]|uniref:GNAT family N-acetyltransferase n=1 Tax=Demequina litoralis TaxID=3051660 RepID=A0ABT8G8C9_9MICO|nr:GNAT family N-acetyltransferase [Demequina sp. SYSU T00192]MDN4475317.1 GNAT family N-acetyltransferase [Demequina sp. SYSU T00192]